MTYRSASHIAEMLRVTLWRIEQREDLDQEATSTVELKRTIRQRISDIMCAAKPLGKLSPLESLATVFSGLRRNCTLPLLLDRLTAVRSSGAALRRPPLY